MRSRLKSRPMERFPLSPTWWRSAFSLQPRWSPWCSPKHGLAFAFLRYGRAAACWGGRLSLDDDTPASSRRGRRERRRTSRIARRATASWRPRPVVRRDFLAAPVSRHLSVGPGVPLHILRGRCIFFIYRQALQGLARAPIRGCCFSSWLVAAHAALTSSAGRGLFWRVVRNWLSLAIISASSGRTGRRRRASLGRARRARWRHGAQARGGAPRGP